MNSIDMETMHSIDLEMMTEHLLRNDGLTFCQRNVMTERKLTRFNI